MPTAVNQERKCDKCGANLIDTRVTFRGNQYVPDPKGKQIRTACENAHFYGYRPAKPG